MVQRLVEVWRRKTEDLVWRAALSRDGQKVAFGSWDNRAYCYSRQGDPVCTRESAGHTSVGLAADGSLLVSGSYDKTVTATDERGQEVWSYTADHFVRDLAVHGAGVAVAFWQGPIIALDLRGALLWSQAIEGNPLAVAASDDGSLVVVGTEEKKAIALDREGAVRWTFVGGGGITRVAVSGDGGTVVVGSTDTIVAVLDGRTGALRWRYKTGSSIRGVALSEGGEYVLVGCHENFLYLFDLDGQLRWIDRTDGEIWSVATTALADLIAIGTGSNQGLLLEHKEAILEQLDRLGDEIKQLRDSGAEVEGLERMLVAARSASTDGDRDALGKRLRTVRSTLLEVRRSYFHDQVTKGLLELERARKELSTKDTSLLQLMSTQATALLEAGEMARASKLVSRALALRENLPPLLEDLTAGTKGTEQPAVKDDSGPGQTIKRFATVCDTCERPLRPDWTECPFCGHPVIG